jgi:hypothetical protein
MSNVPKPLSDHSCPHDMLKYFDATDEDLSVIEIAVSLDETTWFKLEEPFMPDATLLVALYQQSVRKIAVKCHDRVVEFTLYDVILRDGELKGTER